MGTTWKLSCRLGMLALAPFFAMHTHVVSGPTCTNDPETCQVGSVVHHADWDFCDPHIYDIVCMPAVGPTRNVDSDDDMAMITNTSQSTDRPESTAVSTLAGTTDVADGLLNGPLSPHWWNMLLVSLIMTFLFVATRCKSKTSKPTTWAGSEQSQGQKA